MLLTHNNDTLNTYLVDVNLRMAKLLNILTYLFLFLFSLVLKILVCYDCFGFVCTFQSLCQSV